MKANPLSYPWLAGNAILACLLMGASALAAARSAGDKAGSADVAALREEVRTKGWIAFSARTDKGDMDIFLCRPDGGEKRNITQTPDANEGLAQFSRDGSRLMYRRLARTETFDNNRHGEMGVLVIARSDGTQGKAIGAAGEFPWASWSPDGRQLLCLSPKGFQIADIESRRIVRTFPRGGFFQQTVWSPDGKWLVGVANSFGESWSVGRMNLEGGAASAVNKIDCCTPDWFPDSASVIFSWRPPGQGVNNGQGWTQLWRADAEGKSRQLVYGEDGRHVYGGHVSPDGRYVLFTGNMKEDGDPGGGGAPMGLMRLRDAPLIGGKSPALRKKFPGAKSGPVLVLPSGWEPSWTAGEAPAGRAEGKP